MSTKIDVRDLPARFSQAVSEASAGGDVIIMEGDTPRARLVPIEPDPTPRGKRIPGLHPGAFQIAPDFDDPLPDEFWLGDTESD